MLDPSYSSVLSSVSQSSQEWPKKYKSLNFIFLFHLPLEVPGPDYSFSPSKAPWRGLPPPSRLACYGTDPRTFLKLETAAPQATDTEKYKFLSRNLSKLFQVSFSASSSTAAGSVSGQELQLVWISQFCPSLWYWQKQCNRCHNPILLQPARRNAQIAVKEPNFLNANTTPCFISQVSQRGGNQNTNDNTCISDHINSCKSQGCSRIKENPPWTCHTTAPSPLQLPQKLQFYINGNFQFHIFWYF